MCVCVYACMCAYIYIDVCGQHPILGIPRLCMLSLVFGDQDPVDLLVRKNGTFFPQPCIDLGKGTWVDFRSRI